MGIYIVGITGASGAIYAKRLLEELIKSGQTVYLTVTDPGQRLLQEELGWRIVANADCAEKDLRSLLGLATDDQQLRYFDVHDVGALIASGSVKIAGMIIVPCTMSTVSAVAHGNAADLLQRAADVTIKERRKLVIVPRETPLSAIHLENMLTLAKLGVQIIPAMPAFYHHPQSISDLVDFLVGRILDYFDLPHDLSQRWQG